MPASMLGFGRDDLAGYVDRQVLDLPQVIISAGRLDAGPALSPDDLVRAMAAEVENLCEDE